MLRSPPPHTHTHLHTPTKITTLCAQSWLCTSQSYKAELGLENEKYKELINAITQSYKDIAYNDLHTTCASLKHKHTHTHTHTQTPDLKLLPEMSSRIDRH